MATGWAGDGAVQDQIDATIKDGVRRAQQRLPSGMNSAPSPTHCLRCGAAIPEARRAAMPGVISCVPCQEAEDRDLTQFSGYNRRGSKDSQLR